MLRHDEIDRFRLSDQNTLLLHSTPQNEFVAGIGKNVATPKYVVPFFAQRLSCPTPHAAVQEQLQAAAGTGSGKTVSEPTVARAYSKQAKISSRSSQG